MVAAGLATTASLGGGHEGVEPRTVDGEDEAWIGAELPGTHRQRVGKALADCSAAGSRAAAGSKNTGLMLLISA